MVEALGLNLVGRVAVVGVGDSGHGDDGAGPMLARILAEAAIEHVIDGGSAPELETWRLRDIQPETVLFVDAVDFGAAPGDAALLVSEKLRSGGFDTHKAPLKLTMEYIHQEFAAACFLLAIQPRNVRPGASMCEEVRRTVENLARLLCEQLVSTCINS